MPPGYALHKWESEEEPIELLGTIFDDDSLGKWIYDWAVYACGPSTSTADTAGDLWLLLIRLAGKTKSAEEALPWVREGENKDMLQDFIESSERLGNNLTLEGLRGANAGGFEGVEARRERRHRARGYPFRKGEGARDDGPLHEIHQIMDYAI